MITFNNNNNIFDFDIDRRKEILGQIILEWGKSTVTLKNWLKNFYPQPLDKRYSKKASINADVFLPYRKNVLWSGETAISRLKLAAKAKIIIIFSDSDLEEKDQFNTYIIECLRLWCRIDSLRTNFSFKQFNDLLIKTYEYTIQNWDEVVEELQDKQEKFKFKRKQTLYHYKAEDFNCVYPFMTLREAYKDWIEYNFPNLLKYYKIQKVNEFKLEAMVNEWSQEMKEFKYKQLEADLALVRIKEPSVQAFRKLLDRFNIEYKQKKH